MDKNISVTDLQLIPELSHLRMIDFINPDNDALIAPFLKTIGFDLDYPIMFEASQHRNMQGKVVIAYRILGEVEINSSFQDSVWCTPEDRLIAVGYRDLGFAKEIAKSLVSAREYETSGTGEGFPPDQCNPDEEEIKMQVKVLEDLLLAIRGTPFKQNGSRATLAEYGQTEPPEKRRKKVIRKKDLLSE
jgi:hypothetical protein